MPMLIVGVLLLVAKMSGFGPTANWSWWVVLAPFAMATVWWAISDKLGLTQRKAMKRMQDRKDKRRLAAMESLGLHKSRQKQVTRGQEEVQRRAGTSADPTHGDS